MKRFLWLLPLSIVLYACPFESPVPMEAKPVETVDTSLIGYWYGIVKDGSDFFGIEALEISKDGDSTYDIIRYGKTAKGDMILPDTAHFTGYISYLDGQRYMNIVSTLVTVTTRKKKEPLVTTTKIFYVAQFQTRHDTMVVKTITEEFKPRSKNFRTPDELKQYVKELNDNHQNIFDDLYSLSYHRIPKPVPLKPM